MNKGKYIPALSIIVFTMTSCATAPTVDEIVADGGIIVEFEELIGDSGVTFVGEGDAWYNYLV
ncbi:hypothetical protein [Granulosicoccus antarcticus]|uniref:Uncharacterized protein n=1 Tax=Granulosicoccus antarcticus IMCC3135 TaxID=1192854 RepID=A0A2Z2NPE5_9GAMM|nr:hypothetical protein [Granulosicoccus antarcticus]ASJ70650.1 hypothetical protein IMCC3135_02685 [Granulosicoccus antarcticus IMCC3135]